MPLLQSLKEPLEAIEPMQAVFDQKFVKRLNGPNVKAGGSKMDYAEGVMEDIRQFQKRTKVSRTTMIWCGSTEVYHEAAEVHSSLERFERGLRENDPEISPSQIYAYAALKSGVPYANGAPHMTTDMPALLELARDRSLPLAGKDYKSGQTFMKTLIAPGLKSRLLGVNGWFSTNILGNRDGEVLDDPGSFRSKEVSKSSALEYILQKLAVTHPSAGNIGGGGFMLIRLADGRTTFLDFRERAPMAASRNMYLDAAGKATQDSVTGYRAVGVPGTVRGLEYANKK